MSQAFPPNSHKANAVPAADRKIERVTSEEPVRRKKSLGKQFTSTFIGGDARTAMHYVVFSVLIPAAKDALAEAGSQGIERLIFGDSRGRAPGRRPSGPSGFVNYGKFSKDDRPPLPKMSKRGRAAHDFDEIVLSSRQEAEAVIDRLWDIMARYESVTVSDLYDLVGLRSEHTDQKWGWDELHGAGVTRVKGGFLLDLPEPEPLG